MKSYYIISTKNYDYLKEIILSKNNNIKEIRCEKKYFADGERYYKLNLNDVSGRDILLIGGTSCDKDVLEIFDLGSALVKYGAKSLRIVCPYFGYSTMERAVSDGEIVIAKTRSRLLSAIPIATEGNKIVLFDLHSEGITYYFEGNLVPKHIHGYSFFKDCLNIINEKEDLMIGATDAGRAKYVESLGKVFNLDTAFVYKKRDADSVRITGINADVKNKNIIVYDDMVRSGKSLINAITAYKNAGANKIYVVSTHAVLCSDLSKIEVIEKELLKNANGLFFSNSHPNSRLLKKSSIIDISDFYKE